MIGALFSLIYDVIAWAFDVAGLAVLFVIFAIVGSIAWHYLSWFLDL